jgi:outer membrane lipoprotein-sorting protein
MSSITSIFLLTGFGFTDEVNDIIKNIQKTYDKMDHFSAVFKQVETFKITGSKTETIGKIYVSDGEKYRFESEDQVVVTDGKSVWTYNAISKQLLIDNVREDSGVLLPRDLLFNYPKTYFATLLSEDDSGKRKV